MSRMPHERVFIYGLLNDAVSSLECTASYKWVVSEYGLEGMQREPVVVKFEVLSWLLAGSTE
jgi:hypothetical protein